MLRTVSGALARGRERQLDGGQVRRPSHDLACPLSETGARRIKVQIFVMIMVMTMLTHTHTHTKTTKNYKLEKYKKYKNYKKKLQT